MSKYTTKTYGKAGIFATESDMHEAITGHPLITEKMIAAGKHAYYSHKIVNINDQIKAIYKAMKEAQ